MLFSLLVFQYSLAGKCNATYGQLQTYAARLEPNKHHMPDLSSPGLHLQQRLQWARRRGDGAWLHEADQEPTHAHLACVCCMVHDMFVTYAHPPWHLLAASGVCMLGACSINCKCVQSCHHDWVYLCNRKLAHFAKAQCFFMAMPGHT